MALGRPAAPGALPGSMAALVAAYRASPQWRELAPGSRKDYDKSLNPLAERYGKLPMAGMPRQFVFKPQAEYSTMPAFTPHDPPQPILDAKGCQVILQTPRRANGMLNVLRLLLAWAVNQGGWVKTNVAVRPGRLETGPGHQMWKPADLAALWRRPGSRYAGPRCWPSAPASARAIAWQCFARREPGARLTWCKPRRAPRYRYPSTLT